MEEKKALQPEELAEVSGGLRKGPVVASVTGSAVTAEVLTLDPTDYPHPKPIPHEDE